VSKGFNELAVLWSNCSVKHWRKILAIVLVLGVGGGVFYWKSGRDAGVELDRYKGVVVYDNGPIVARSFGRHYAADGYYFGQKWQCVEFVKRFYYEAKGHRMPDVWGHAKDFFEESVEQGGLNKRRGLVQFRNGGGERPAVDDLVVFDGAYGHVAIISEVGSNYVEVVQQNIYGRPRERFEWEWTNGAAKFQLKKVKGWLRKI
jgi:surface antigen